MARTEDEYSYGSTSYSSRWSNMNVWDRHALGE